MNFSKLTESTPSLIVKAVLKNEAFLAYAKAVYNSLYQSSLIRFKDYGFENLQEYCSNDAARTLENLVVKLIVSILKYTEDNDNIITFNARVSAGNFNFYAEVERDGKEYNFTLESIIAGGYNIQCEHIRYICKGNLPKSNNTNAKRFSRLKDLKLNLAGEKRYRVNVVDSLKVAEAAGNKREIRERKKSLEKQDIKIQKIEAKIAAL